MVCSVCIKRLEGIHRFAMMAYRTQEKLRSQLYDNIDNTNPVQDEEMQSIKDTQERYKNMQDNAKKVEERGLLHSILTKVCATYSSIFLLIIISVCVCICVIYIYIYILHFCVQDISTYHRFI